MSDDTTPQELGADQWRERMLGIAVSLLKDPPRELTPDEIDLFRKAAKALAEMLLTMDEKLCQGYVPPRAWLRDVPAPGELPTSPLHATLKGEADHLVQQLLHRISEKVAAKDPQAAKYLLEKLTALLGTLARFTSESVRLACLNNLKPEAAAEKPHLALVHSEPKTGRSSDQEN